MSQGTVLQFSVLRLFYIKRGVFVQIIDKSLYLEIKRILESARFKAYSAVNFAMVEAYWNIGKSIVEKQGNDVRAEYGSGLLKELSRLLTIDFGGGFEESNLRRMRQFYIAFQNCGALRHELSWTHYRLLIKVENERARQFYLDECSKANWSTRQLERQINSFFYERLLSSKEKEPVRDEILTLEKGIAAHDVIRDPYVLEFLGLEQSPSLYEKDLEHALIEHLQKFLLELGRGFSFVARQKRITFDGRHFFIDLVFYNYILKCFVCG
jgi:predicted nuclease of restriction endonuclease-like (RecB) superfamily